MASVLRQKDRVAVLTTSAGEDTFVLVKCEVEEALSELFAIRIEALCLQPGFPIETLIGQKMSVAFRLRNNSQRVFNGILTEAQWLGGDEDGYVYRFTLRPWLWLLSQRNDCRIFQNQSAPDIIRKIFAKQDGADFQPRLSENYKPIPYCVQYRESDLSFVLRLMEQYGIYYYFKHSTDGHQLVLCDSKTAHEKVVASTGPDGGGSVGGAFPLLPRGSQTRRHAEHMIHWSTQRRLRTGRIELQDYDFTKSTADLRGHREDGLAQARAYEMFDYPGEHTERSDGEQFAMIKVQAEQALDDRRFATGDAVSLYPGGLMTLSRHPVAKENIEYLVVRASHVFGLQAYRTGRRGEDEIYHGTYEFLKGDKRFRAPAVTPKPIIHGPQTAKVVGPRNAGTEGDIDVDEYGRILVRFHWDREDGSTSCRVRVGQMWAGKQWGGQVIPRIGQEVIIEHLEGNPDRPICVGAVVNDQHMPPYQLPAKKTQSGLKSESTDGGGKQGKYNEIKFEDKANNELFSFRAEKDLAGVVLEKETREVAERLTGGVARKTTIKNGDDELYVNNGRIYAKASKEITFEVGSSKITMLPNSIEIKSPTITIKADMNMTVEAGASMTTKAGGTMTIKGGMVLIN